MKLWSVVLLAALALVHADAEAKRLGGSKSLGRQSPNVTQREAAAPAAVPAAPAAAAKP
ncbi:Tim44 domain-containing protein, partial [Ramlibacter sp. H39-3-26]|nr:Tim44 domain-containing protein [Ramlibacter sp. H39-3-26]